MDYNGAVYTVTCKSFELLSEILKTEEKGGFSHALCVTLSPFEPNMLRKEIFNKSSHVSNVAWSHERGYQA